MYLRKHERGHQDSKVSFTSDLQRLHAKTPEFEEEEEEAEVEVLAELFIQEVHVDCPSMLRSLPYQYTLCLSCAVSYLFQCRSD